jgi:hypothetical protein
MSSVARRQTDEGRDQQKAPRELAISVGRPDIHLPLHWREHVSFGAPSSNCQELFGKISIG